MRSNLFPAAILIGGSLSTIACGRLPGNEPPPAAVWIVPSPDQRPQNYRSAFSADIADFVGALIVIDSSTLSPVEGAQLPAGSTSQSRTALVTTFQGNRYHAESIRALAEDSVAVGAFAGRVTAAAARNGAGIFVDFQGDTPEELKGTTSLSRAIADSARARHLSPVGVVVPPGDTIGYPTAVLARTFDLIVVRLHGEHRPGTAPGALVSPAWMSRQIGIRAYDIGANRLVAELPLFGYRWDRSGAVARITYADAQTLVRSEAAFSNEIPLLDRSRHHRHAMAGRSGSKTRRLSRN
jgi:Predicted glycosyl hydrolase